MDPIIDPKYFLLQLVKVTEEICIIVIHHQVDQSVQFADQLLNELSE